jgi:Protein of unknown function (DUF3352)
LWGLPIRALALVAILFVAGCGGGGADGEGDPASLVPADALVYLEAVARPEGSQREDALAAAGKLLRTDDPTARIEELLSGEVAEFDYERDLEPWLGERIGFWANTREGDEGVAILSATDTDKARESLDRELRSEGQTLTDRSHRGVEYNVNSDGVAAAVIDDFAAIGREADLKRTIDAAEGDSLAETDRYSDAIDALEEEPLAHVWADTRGLFELAARQDPEIEQLRPLVPLDDLPPVAVGFVADGERLAVEVAARGREDLRLGSLLEGGGTPLLQELPGDTWAAYGVHELGKSARESIDRFGGAFGGVAIRSQLKRETGLDLDRDLLDWIGHAAVFVRGTSADSVDGGVVIQPSDEEKAADAFGRLAGAIQQAAGGPTRPIDVEGAEQALAINDAEAPRPLVFARGSGLVVLTYGEAAAEAALGSDDRLGETDTYEEAQDLVGMEPGFLVSMPEVLELAEATGAGSDADFTAARPYLEAFSVIAGGTIGDGDKFIGRLGAGLR